MRGTLSRRSLRTTASLALGPRSQNGPGLVKSFSSVHRPRNPYKTLNPQAHLDDFRWLTSDQAAPWLRRVAEHPQPSVALAQRLRRDLSAERTHLLLQLAQLRLHAAAKFPHASRLFFTSTGLQQATDHWVAAYKASRFAPGEPVADLCCGIGGDLLALAARGPVVGVDRDPATALVAEANLRATAHLRSQDVPAEVRAADVGAIGLREFAAWHIDPDRRPQGRRTTHVDLHEPDASVLQRLLDENPNAALKLAPAAEVPAAWARQAELEWISRDRQCRQLVAWFGSLARQSGLCRATILIHGSPDGPCQLRSLTGTPSLAFPVAPAIGRYVFDPDASVLASRLTSTLAESHGLAAVAPDIPYLTGDRPVFDPALACFEVLEILPLDRKRLRALLEARGIGQLEIKKRGIPDDPEQLRRQLRLRGHQSAVLLLAPIAGSTTTILARRLAHFSAGNPGI